MAGKIRAATGQRLQMAGPVPATKKRARPAALRLALTLNRSASRHAKIVSAIIPKFSIFDLLPLTDIIYDMGVSVLGSWANTEAS